MIFHMNPKQTVKKILRYALLASIGSMQAVLFADEGSSLLQRSPFLPPNYNTKPLIVTPPQNTRPTLPPQPPQIELRGIMELNGNVQFSIFDKKTQKGTWVYLNEEQDGFRVSAYDKINQSVALAHNGSTFTIELKQPALEMPIGSKTAPTTVATPANVAAGAAQPAPATATATAPANDAATATEGGGRRSRNINSIRESIQNLNN